MNEPFRAHGLINMAQLSVWAVWAVAILKDFGCALILERETKSNLISTASLLLIISVRCYMIYSFFSPNGEKMNK